MRSGENVSKLSVLKELVGAPRFELGTPCAQGRCATRLRYAPTCTRSYQTSAADVEAAVVGARARAKSARWATESVKALHESRIQVVDASQTAGVDCHDLLA